MNRKLLIKKFLSDQCSAEEAKQVFAWWQEDPSLLDELISEEEWTSYISAKNKSTSQWKGAVKASLIILLFGLIAFFSDVRLKPSSEIYQFSSSKLYNQIYYNPLSQEKEVILADHSHVTLSPGALMQVHMQPDQDIRLVRLLQGKAYFKVAKDVSKPFVVQSQDLKTTALGTEFTVDYDVNSQHVMIQLLEGKVRVEQPGKSNKPVAKILKPGQQVESFNFSEMVLSQFIPTKNKIALNNSRNKKVKTDKQQIYHYSTSIHDSEDWLVLEGTSVSDIMQYINYELDNPIAYDSLSVRNYRIKGRFKKNGEMTIGYKDQLAASILQLIVEMNPFELEKKYNTYILKPKK